MIGNKFRWCLALLLFALGNVLSVQGQADTTAPVLVGLTVPTQVDTTAADANLIFFVHATDDISGIMHVAGAIWSPSGQIGLNISNTTDGLISGTPLDGTFQIGRALPAHSEAGVWTITYLTLYDKAYNTRTYSTAQLQAAGFPTSFAVTDLQPDTTAPILTGLAIFPQQVDTGTSPANVTFSFHATDDVSGIEHVMGAVASPSRKSSLGFGSQSDIPVSGTALDGTLQAIVSLPAHSEEGLWTITSLSIYDKDYNTRSYSTADLQAAGLQTAFTVTDVQPDTTAPVLVGFGISPRQVDTGSNPATITFSFHATDDISGTYHASGVVTSPSGLKLSFSSEANPPISGTALDGTYQAIFTLPAHSEAGVWTVTSLSIDDKGYNRRDYSTADLQAAGFPSTFTNVVSTPYKAYVQPPINSDETSVFSAKRGVIPVKFTLTADDLPTCALPDATISVSRTAGGVVGSIDESTYLAASDGGSDFRIDPTACQYIYNLAVSSLGGVGTYRVNININGIAVGHAVFALK